MGRSDLIGPAKHQLIPANQPTADDGYQSARRKNSTPVGSKKAGNAGKMLTQHTGLPPRASDGSKPWDKREQAKAAAFAKLQEQKKNSGKGASGKKKPRPAVPR